MEHAPFAHWTGEGADDRAGRPIAIPAGPTNPDDRAVLPEDHDALGAARAWHNSAGELHCAQGPRGELYPSIVEAPARGKTHGPRHWVGADGLYVPRADGQPNYVWPGVAMEWRNGDGAAMRTARGGDGRELPCRATAGGYVRWADQRGYHRTDVDAAGSSLPACVGEAGSAERVYAVGDVYVRRVAGAVVPANAVRADGTVCCYAHSSRTGNRRLHTESADQPSEYNPATGYRAWHCKGKLHSPGPDAPALVDPAVGLTLFAVHGLPHRDPDERGRSQPAEIRTRADGPALERYFRGGVLHRPYAEGPAAVDAGGLNPRYHFAGELYRLDGPAAMYDGVPRYYVEPNKPCTRAEMLAFAKSGRVTRLAVPSRPTVGEHRPSPRRSDNRTRGRDGGARRR
jgi:hypothetical protein